MGHTQDFIFKAGEIDAYIQGLKDSGIDKLLVVNGNYATRYPEMVNSVVGSTQWLFDRYIRTSPDKDHFGILVTSDSDDCLNNFHQPRLRPAATGMNETQRVSHVLAPLLAQFSQRTDGINVPVNAVLYDGFKHDEELRMTELDAIRDAGIALVATSKSAPWGLPHPVGSPVWYAGMFDHFHTTVWNDPKQGSIMEQAVRADRTEQQGDGMTPEVIQTLKTMIDKGQIVNLFDRQVILQHKGNPILDANGQPFAIEPQIAPSGKPYMQIAKPHVPKGYFVENAAQQYINYGNDGAAPTPKAP